MQQAGKASTSTRGFASMDREKQREIARKGGVVSQMKNAVSRKTTSSRQKLAARADIRHTVADALHLKAIARAGDGFDKS